MAKLSPSEFREKHAKRLKASIPEIEAGINRVTEAPGQKAAAKQEKMKTNLIKAIDEGTWGRRVAAVSLEEWKEKILTKGINRISSGIDAAAGKVEDFAAQLLPHVDAGVAKLAKMPDLTLDDNIARSAAMIRHMAKFKKK